MRTRLLRTVLTTVVMASGFLSAKASAQTATLVDNRVIIDNRPFYSIGSEDGLGGANFALNSADFIDIPYAIFDFGSSTTVSNAFLTWNFQSLFSSPPAQISLYVGNDADGAITIGDRFVGSLADTYVYAGATSRTFDITSFVNSALTSGRYVAARFEATVPPEQLRGYYGGWFDTPSLTYNVSTVPEPGTYALMLTGLCTLALAARTRKHRAM